MDESLLPYFQTVSRKLGPIPPPASPPWQPTQLFSMNSTRPCAATVSDRPAGVSVVLSALDSRLPSAARGLALHPANVAVANVIAIMKYRCMNSSYGLRAFAHGLASGTWYSARI